MGIAADANPNQSDKSITYTWDDRNGDRRWQPGEEGNVTESTLSNSISADPDISQPYSHDVALYLEHQVTDTIGARVGFVYKTGDDLFGAFRPGRSVLSSAYSVPYEFRDVGADNISGTTDDQILTLFGVPTAQQGTSRSLRS